MNLGVNLVYTDACALAEHAEKLGFDLALAPEGYKNDAPSVLGAVAANTSRINLASGVMQIPARPPALAALTAATLAYLSGGRFRLGLGVSNPDVSDGWYGVPFDKPLARTREYIEVVRLALAGGPVRYQGAHFRLPASGADGAPLHVITESSGQGVPVYLAAVGPRNQRLAGELADGWIGVFTPPEAVAEAIGHIAAGRRAAGKDLAGFAVVPSLPTFVGDVPEAADALRAHYVYMLGIGTPDKNFYCALAERMGFGKDVAAVRERLAAGDRRAAGAAVPRDFIDRTALIGPVARIADRMTAYAEAGVTTLGIMVSAAATTPDGRLEILSGCAAALEHAGVGG